MQAKIGTHNDVKPLSNVSFLSSQAMSLQTHSAYFLDARRKETYEESHIQLARSAPKVLYDVMNK